MGLKEDVLEVICKVLDVEKREVALDKTLYDSLSVDSTEMVELSVALNKKLGVKLEQREITNKNTVSEIVNIIKNKINE